LGFCLFAHLLQLFGGVEAVVGLFLVDKFVYVFVVDVFSLRLEIWLIWTSDFRAFVPVDTEPSQVVYDLSGGRGSVALEVGIFDAEYEFATHPPGEEPAKKGGPSAAHVQITSRRWCKTGYKLFRHRLLFLTLIRPNLQKC
jgi:hypothetical protein